MDARIRRAETDADLAEIARVVNAVTPDEPTSVDVMRWADATYPGGARFVADTGGGIAGAAAVSRLYMYPPDFDAYWASIGVLPEARRHGLGGALLGAVSSDARAAGKAALHIPASEERPDGISFLANRGFRVHERQRIARLELAGLAPPDIAPPTGIDITTLAQHPDLVEGVHAVAVEAFADMPTGGQRVAPGDLAEFRARDVDRATIPKDAFVVAIDRASGDVVGYSNLVVPAGSTSFAWHDVTAVARGWRRHGIASACKRATIGWAIRNGFRYLDTGSHPDNEPMRAINARLGFRARPDKVMMRGQLTRAIDDDASLRR